MNYDDPINSHGWTTPHSAPRPSRTPRTTPAHAFPELFKYVRHVFCPLQPAVRLTKRPTIDSLPRLDGTAHTPKAGETSVNLAAQEIKEVARLLEVRSGGYGYGHGQSGREQPIRTASQYGGAGGGQDVSRTSSGLSGGGGGQGVRRGFSTYSEDDGCADALYTQDL